MPLVITARPEGGRRRFISRVLFHARARIIIIIISRLRASRTRASQLCSRLASRTRISMSDAELPGRALASSRVERYGAETDAFFEELADEAFAELARSRYAFDFMASEYAGVRARALEKAVKVTVRPPGVNARFNPLGRKTRRRMYRALARRVETSRADAVRAATMDDEWNANFGRGCVRVVHNAQDLATGGMFDPREQLFCVVKRDVWDAFDHFVTPWCERAKRALSKHHARSHRGIINILTPHGQPIEWDAAAPHIRASRRRTTSADADARGRARLIELLNHLKAMKILPRAFHADEHNGSATFIWSEADCERQFVHSDYGGRGTRGEPSFGNSMSLIVALGKDVIFHACEDSQTHDITSTLVLDKGDLLMFAGHAYHAGGEWVGADNARLHAYLGRNLRGKQRVVPADYVVYPAPPKRVDLHGISDTFHRRVKC